MKRAYASPPPASTGSLVIIDKNEAKYALPGPIPGSGAVIDYSLNRDNTPCPNDIARNIQLGEFKSATRIFLCDHDHYSKKEDQVFWLEFLTIRKLTSTQSIELEYIDSYQPGQIIKPGLMLVGKFHKGTEPVRDKLSFVRITAPTAPPAPEP